jgi:iron-sulfur cluster assembly accessory protein
MFKLTTNELKVSLSARTHLRKVVVPPMLGLRLMILSGKGCGGNEYDLRPVVAEKLDLSDEILDVEEGLKIYIPKNDVLKLFGSTIDYVEDQVGNKKIEIINPNEKGRCGCGLSVSF